MQHLYTYTQVAELRPSKSCFSLPECIKIYLSAVASPALLQ